MPESRCPELRKHVRDGSLWGLDLNYGWLDGFPLTMGRDS